MTTASRSVTKQVYSSLAVQHLLPTSSVTLESDSPGYEKCGNMKTQKKKPKIQTTPNKKIPVSNKY